MSDGSRPNLVVIGPNPAIDVTLEAPHFTLGTSHRVSTALRVAGGKPVNTARTAVRLGADVRLVVPLAGEGGCLVAEEASRLGIDLWALPIKEATRSAYIIVDPTVGHSTVINERGPQLSAREAASLEALCFAALDGAAIVAGSGSLPPGIDTDFYARLAAEARRHEMPCIIDTSGEPLRRACRAGAWCVKVNAEELAEVTGESDPLTAARSLLDWGVTHVVVTLGSRGALYTGVDEALRVTAAPGTTMNSVAAGDAFLAGLATGLGRGDGWMEALRLASAAAGLVARQLGPDIGPNPPTQDMMRDVDVVPALAGFSTSY